MKFSTSFSAALLSASTLFLSALCVPQDTPPVPVLVDFYPETNYGGGKYYPASGQYSTCYSVPAQLENAKSLKLGTDVKECHMFETAACKKVKGKYKVYSKDEPDVTLSPVLSLECYKK